MYAMTLTFDLISDLHVETWSEFDWTACATSPICVLAGDVARDPDILQGTLQHLAECYQKVFYIDGNEEHKYHWDDLDRNYSDIAAMVAAIPDLVYLRDNVVIIQGVAFLGSNVWWDWNFDTGIDQIQSKAWFQDRQQCNPHVADMIAAHSKNDLDYLYDGIKRLQSHQDVKKIVVISHTVPSVNLICHDVDLEGTCRINTMGNSLAERLRSADSKKKISHWCFGHYHGSIDKEIDNVRYVNNCRGRGSTPYSQYVYHPLRIEVPL